VALGALAERHGTPLYVYSAGAIRAAYEELDSAFAGAPRRVCYSVKANPNLSVCRLLAGLGAGADVTSGGELARALRAGFEPERIVFAGVGKSREELEAALAARIGLFSVESEGELRLLSEVAAGRGDRAPFSLRVNPDVDARTHPHITTGLAGSKFGVPLAEARALYRLAGSLPGLRVEGVGMHIGSQMADLSPMLQAAESLAALARDLLAEGFPLRVFDVGGGYAIGYDGAAPQPPGRVGPRLAELARGLGLTLVTEPGRFLVGRAGALLLRVLYRKRGPDREFIVLDGGMSAFLRPALYGARHRIVAVRAGAGVVRAEVVGPVCESSDVLSRDADAPDARPGELVAALDAGAYGFSMASEYNGRPRPAEVLVDGSEARLIRRRQAHEELMAPEAELLGE
jgi:diaminopimelate decarboxylase